MKLIILYLMIIAIAIGLSLNMFLEHVTEMRGGVLGYGEKDFLRKVIMTGYILCTGMLFMSYFLNKIIEWFSVYVH